MNPEQKPIDLGAIKARCEAASPGPWCYEPDLDGSSMGWIISETEPFATELFDVRGDSAQQAINAIFVAHARQDIPALIAEVERQKSLVNYWVSAHGEASRRAAESDREVERLRRELEDTRKQLLDEGNEAVVVVQKLSDAWAEVAHLKRLAECPDCKHVPPSEPRFYPPCPNCGFCSPNIAKES